jgi:hypothetical protein
MDQQMLVNEFIQWGGSLKPRLLRTSKIEISSNSNYDTLTACISLYDETTLLQIMLWDSGVHEYFRQIIESETKLDFYFGETISPNEFEEIFAPATKFYLRALPP